MCNIRKALKLYNHKYYALWNCSLHRKTKKPPSERVFIFYSQLPFLRQLISAEKIIHFSELVGSADRYIFEKVKLCLAR